MQVLKVTDLKETSKQHKQLKNDAEEWTRNLFYSPGSRSG